MVAHSLDLADAILPPLTAEQKVKRKLVNLQLGKPRQRQQLDLTVIDTRSSIPHDGTDRTGSDRTEKLEEMQKESKPQRTRRFIFVALTSDCLERACPYTKTRQRQRHLRPGLLLLLQGRHISGHLGVLDHTERPSRPFCVHQWLFLFRFCCLRLSNGDVNCVLYPVSCLTSLCQDYHYKISKDRSWVGI